MQRRRSAFGFFADSWVIFANHFRNEIENLRGRDLWNTTNEHVKRATEGRFTRPLPTVATPWLVASMHRTTNRF
jgi:hypothetical protein